ncbi:uncharacterized protein DNG_03619 [Cephalotrichum gorgonifer]|uniref:Uncharacterized protein n=1 Tax=Cephalotrichum gorgonifer TaxID=2041049 RepID=A0AAE8MVN5_9PEZI|nr:uncharacterized protein DNG_03619 [Cephalotrichum gorgonifer]
MPIYKTGDGASTSPRAPGTPAQGRAPETPRHVGSTPEPATGPETASGPSDHPSSRTIARDKSPYIPERIGDVWLPRDVVFSKQPLTDPEITVWALQRNETPKSWAPTRTPGAQEWAATITGSSKRARGWGQGGLPERLGDLRPEKAARLTGWSRSTSHPGTFRVVKLPAATANVLGELKSMHWEALMDMLKAVTDGVDARESEPEWVSGHPGVVDRRRG